MYNPSEDTNDVQSLRCTQFRKGAGKPENLPPTRDALRHHILRANYQAFIWRTSNVANQQIPCPTTSGWTLSQTSLTPILMTQDRLCGCNSIYTVVQKNAPTLADYNYDPVQSILIIFSKLFVNDHKSCLIVKFSTSPHICCHYTL